MPIAGVRLVVSLCSVKISTSRMLSGEVFRLRGALGWSGSLKSSRGMRVESIVETVDVCCIGKMVGKVQEIVRVGLVRHPNWLRSCVYHTRNRLQYTTRIACGPVSTTAKIPF